MYDSSKFKLGLFVCFAVLVFMSSIAILGFFKQFTEKAELCTVFSESINGLNEGSIVKYQGVPIGKVDDIFILKGNQICVIMEIDLEQFRIYDPKNKSTDILDEEKFYERVKLGREHGMRCTLQLDGIVGGKYIQIDLNEERKPVETDLDPKEIGLDPKKFIPAEHSTLDSLLASISTIAESLKSLNYQGISAQFTDLLKQGEELLNSGNKLITDSNSIIKSDDVSATIANIRSISEKVNQVTDNVNEAMSKDKLNKLSDDISNTVKSIRDLSDTIKTQTESIEFEELTDDARSTLVSFQQTARTLEDTMAKLNNGIGVMIELIEHIENDPQFLLRGKGNPQADKE